MSKEVKADAQQLKGAFRSHNKIIKESKNNDSPSLELLRFYACECALKALYIQKNNLRDTGDFEHVKGFHGKKYGHGHDILKWLGELKLPNFAASFKDKEKDPLIKCHQKLRYGVGVHPNQIAFIKGLNTELKKHLQS